MLTKAAQIIIPYNDLVEMFYISMCNRFVIPHNPTVALLGFSEVEYLIKECFNGVLYEIVGNSSYSANLDETVLPMFREKLKTALLMNGYMDIVKPIMWFDNWVEETIFPKIIERSDSLRGTGIYKYRIDWMFDQGCVLVSL